MILPGSPMLYLVVVVAVLVYYACKRGGSSTRKEKTSNEEFVKWFREREIERSPENVRYQNWLYDHRKS